MPHLRAELVSRPIDPAALIAEVYAAGRGATCSFVGTVRDRHAGRSVTGLEYTAYDAMARVELAAIAEEAAARFEGAAVVVEHRLGSLAVGEVSVAIAAAHERRGNAIGAMTYVIEELKQRLPVWKREHYADGAREWVNAASGSSRVSSTYTAEAPQQGSLSLS
jgi:molybdopterin synthase catalytic subunit